MKFTLVLLPDNFTNKSISLKSSHQTKRVSSHPIACTNLVGNSGNHLFESRCAEDGNRQPTNDCIIVFPALVQDQQLETPTTHELFVNYIPPLPQTRKQTCGFRTPFQALMGHTKGFREHPTQKLLTIPFQALKSHNSKSPNRILTKVKGSKCHILGPMDRVVKLGLLHRSEEF